MQSLIRRRRGSPHALLALATLAIAAGCNPDDPLPTAPRIAPAGSPKTAVIGASVIEFPGIDGCCPDRIVSRDINDAGQVVGRASDRFANYRAFLWSATEGMKDLGTLGGPNAEANAINEAGQVVGTSEVASGRWHAFLWTPGRGMRDLGTIGDAGSIARGINDHGEVVGAAYTQVGSSFESIALKWNSDGTMVQLGTLGGRITDAAAINDAGQVTGTGVTLAGEGHVFLWTAERGIQDLGGFPGEATDATSINEHGQIVGFAVVQPYGRPFIWEAGQGFRKLSTLGGPDVASGKDINDAGQVVGSFPTSGGGHGYVWSLASGTDDLYAIAGMTEASAINNRGQVVGKNLVATLQFAVPNRAPVPSAGGPYAGQKKKPVVFDGTGSRDPDGDALTYAWDFGDGSPLGGGATPVHEYGEWGTYTVTLTVSDPAGLSATSTTTATIAPPGHLKK